MNNLSIFVKRLMKIGIDITPLGGNYPWIYLEYVNGKRVKDKRFSDHNFTLCFYPKVEGGDCNFLELKETFQIIRKYI